VRHCRDNCAILPYIIGGLECPIMHMKKTRKQSEWYFVKNGITLYPLCEEKGSKSGKKGVMML
jgi:hypothetical protein